jgi:hypothetical protein
MTRRNNNNSNKQGGAKGRQRKVKEEQNSPKSEDSSTSCPTEMTQKRESLENGANSGRNNKFTVTPTVFKRFFGINPASLILGTQKPRPNLLLQFSCPMYRARHSPIHNALSTQCSAFV